MNKKEYQKLYRDKNKEKRKLYQKIYYKEYSKTRPNANMLSRINNFEKHMLYQCKSSAKKGNVHIISDIANRCKGAMSINELIIFAKNIIKLHA